MKNTQKHTQGPWHATNHHVQSLVHEYDGYICKAEGNTKAEAEANARLIAAAPDLLAALKLAATTKEPDDKIERMIWIGRQKIILAAIAKAEGNE